MSSELLKIAAIYQLNTNSLDNKRKAILLWLAQKSPLLVTGSETVYKAINLCGNSKLIVIRDPQSQLDLKTDLKVFQNLNDLSKFSKTYKDILKIFTLSLQGKEKVPLETLVGSSEEFKNIITTSVLILMLDDTFTIGKRKEKLPETYINRWLTKNTISYEFFNNLTEDTLVVISCFNKLDDIRDRLKKFNLQTIGSYLRNNDTSEFGHDSSLLYPNDTFKENLRKTIFYHENLCSRQEFSKICEKNSKNTRCHHFRVIDDGSLEWVYSKGSLDDLQEYRRKLYFTEENMLSSYEENNDVNIIIGDPGIGKSVLVCNFRNNYKKTFWTTLIKVKDCYQYLQNNTEEILKSLEGDLDTNFEKEVFNILKSKKHLTFIWDGIDRMSGEDLNLMLKLIKRLAELSFKQWITSRNYLQNLLEEKFNVLTTTIKPFAEEQQTFYISRQLRNMDFKNLQQILENIKNYVSMVENNDILGIPLQIFMLTELCRQDPALLNGVFSVTKLYEYFIDEKLKKIYIKEILELPSTSTDQKMHAKSTYNNFIKIHQNVALKTVFQEEILTNLDINYEDLEGADQTIPIGIITDINEKGLANFLHFSYAEYLVATYLHKRRKKYSKIMKEFLFQERYDNIRFMFDLLLANNSQPHLAVLCKNPRALENCQLYDCKDEGGRNLLHLASSWGARFPMVASENTQDYVIISIPQSRVDEDALKYQENMLTMLSDKCNPKEKDKLFEMDSFAYADASFCLLPLVKLLPSLQETSFCEFQNIGRTSMLAYYAVRYDYKILLEKMEEIPLVQTQSDATLLHLTTSYNSINCLKFLLKYPKYQQKINYKESVYGWNPLYVAVLNGYDQVAELLIQSGANVNDPDKRGFTPLHLAIQNGRHQVAELLIQSGANVNVPNENGFTPILLASFNGHHQIAEILIQSGANVNDSDAVGSTPVHLASQFGHHQVAELLIQSGANVNAPYENGLTPIHSASGIGHLQVAELLIQSGANVNAPGVVGCTPIHLASLFGHHQVAELLIQSGANVNAPNQKGVTPIHLASQEGHNQVAELLIQSGANVNDLDEKGFTPIHLASQFGHHQVAELLIKSGANVNDPDEQGFTPIHVASFYGHPQVAELLIQSGANVNATNEKGVTPIHLASRNGHHQVAELLIKSGANVNDPDEHQGFTPIHVASLYGHPQVAELLIQSGANVNATNEKGVTPIHLASQNGHHQVAELLIQSGANVNAPNEKGVTPIHLASHERQNQVAELLIQSGANVNDSMVEGLTPIHLASLYGHHQVAVLLIQSGANVNAPNGKGSTPIYIASENGHLAVAQLLLNFHANVNSVNSHGNTPIQAACSRGHVDIVQLLIENGGEINTYDADGDSPLHDACANGYIDVVQLLLEHAVNTHVKNKNGMTPLGLALENNHAEIVKLMLSSFED